MKFFDLNKNFIMKSPGKCNNLTHSQKETCHGDMEKYSYYNSSNLDKAIIFIAKLHHVTVYFPEEWYAKSGIPLEAEKGDKSTGPYWGGVT